MRNIYLIFIILILFSCKKDENNKTNQLLLEGTPELIVQTTDLNIINCVRAESLWDFNLLKTDTLGIVIWEKQYTFSDELHLRKIIRQQDGEFLIAMDQTEHISNGINEYIRLLYFESNGTIKWEKKIDLEDGIEFRDMCYLPDNRFIVCGNFSSYSRFFYCELDESQTLTWIKTYSDSIEYCQVNQVAFQDDSIHVLGSLNGDKVLYLRTDISGQISFQKELQLNTTQFYMTELPTELILIEDSKSGALNIDKIDIGGSIQWQHIYYFPGWDHAKVSTLEVSDNSYFFLGRNSGSGIGEPGSSRNFILKTSYNGNETWQKSLKNENDLIECIDVLESENVISGVSKDPYEYSLAKFYLEIIGN